MLTVQHTAAILESTTSICLVPSCHYTHITIILYLASISVLHNCLPSKNFLDSRTEAKRDCKGENYLHIIALNKNKIFCTFSFSERESFLLLTTPPDEDRLLSSCDSKISFSFSSVRVMSGACSEAVVSWSDDGSVSVGSSWTENSTRLLHVYLATTCMNSAI